MISVHGEYFTKELILIRHLKLSVKIKKASEMDHSGYCFQILNKKKIPSFHHFYSSVTPNLNLNMCSVMSFSRSNEQEITVQLNSETMVNLMIYASDKTRHITQALIQTIIITFRILSANSNNHHYL